MLATECARGYIVVVFDAVHWWCLRSAEKMYTGLYNVYNKIVLNKVYKPQEPYSAVQREYFNQFENAFANAKVSENSDYVVGNMESFMPVIPNNSTFEHISFYPANWPAYSRARVLSPKTMEQNTTLSQNPKTVTAPPAEDFSSTTVNGAKIEVPLPGNVSVTVDPTKMETYVNLNDDGSSSSMVVDTEEPRQNIYPSLNRFSDAPNAAGGTSYVVVARKEDSDFGGRTSVNTASSQPIYDYINTTQKPPGNASVVKREPVYELIPARGASFFNNLFSDFIGTPRPVVGGLQTIGVDNVKNAVSVSWRQYVERFPNRDFSSFPDRLALLEYLPTWLIDNEFKGLSQQDVDNMLVAIFNDNIDTSYAFKQIS